MKPIKQIPIKESLTELEALHKSSKDFLKPRIKLLMILAKDPVTTKSRLAHRLDVAYNSITKWHELYEKGGIDKLLEMNRGKYKTPDRRTLGFLPEVYQAIETRHKGEPFQTYVELHTWLKAHYFPVIKYSTMIKYLDIHFGESLKIGRILDIQIKESIAQLVSIHDKCLPRIKPRIKMLITLKRNEKMSRIELARELNVSYGSVLKWAAIYMQGGIDELTKYNLELVITPEVVAYIEKKFQQNRFTNFSEIYKEVSKKYLPGIKYYTLHRYIHRHFSAELDAAKALNMPIKETVQELEAIYSKSSADKKHRIKMLLSLKTLPALSKIELAKLSGVAVGSIHRWHKLYKEGGLNGLLEIKLRGRKQLLLSAKVHTSIEKKIKQNPDINITELHEWIASVHSEKISYNKLYRYVRRHFIELPKVNFSARLSYERALNRVA